MSGNQRLRPPGKHEDGWTRRRLLHAGIFAAGLLIYKGGDWLIEGDGGGSDKGKQQPSCPSPVLVDGEARQSKTGVVAAVSSDPNGVLTINFTKGFIANGSLRIPQPKLSPYREASSQPSDGSAFIIEPKFGTPKDFTGDVTIGYVSHDKNLQSIGEGMRIYLINGAVQSAVFLTEQQIDLGQPEAPSLP